MKFAVKSLLLGLVSLLVYNYILLPITVPELRVDQVHWTEEDRSWDSQDIFWFVQVTDLHISKYVYPEIKESLEDFMSSTLDTIKPSLVLVSGDLTDGKAEDGVDSFQVVEEWETYWSILARNKVLEKTVYLDIRGNHDSFDVYHLDHQNNLHRNFSAKGSQHPSSYVYNFHFRNKTFSFFAVDATMKTGPKKVFNFLGHLDSEEFNNLMAEKQKHSDNKQIFFGHYPSSCIVAPGSRFRDIIQGGLVYLSGHLHTLSGLAPQLYSLHRGGTPEFELGDWKENRRFRVAAIDNSILTFSDVTQGDWPVVLVTNPKNSKFLAPNVEPITKIRNSSEIRILAFSPANITSVRVQINQGEWKICNRHQLIENLYLLPWDPTSLGTYNHLTVTVQDEWDNQKTVKMKFQVEFSSVETEYSLYARAILMCNAVSVLQFLWVVSLLVAMFPAYLARCRSSVLREVYTLRTCSKLEELAAFSPFYYLYMGTAILSGFGPWHVGEILSGHTGIIFPWGILLSDQLLPSFYPYVFSFTHLLFFQTPLFWSLVYKLKWRLEGGSSNKLLLAVSNIPVTLVLTAQACNLLLLYYFPSRLGIFREICLLIAPMQIVTILAGFLCNGLVSFLITESRRNK